MSVEAVTKAPMERPLKDEAGRYRGDLTEEELQRALDEILGPPPERIPRLPAEGPLDPVFQTRSHVRILRALAHLGDHINLTARDVARRAEISHPRALQVLRELERTGVVRAHRAATHAIYELDDEAPIAALVRTVFERERDLSTDLTGA